MADPSPQPQPQKPNLTTHPLVTKLLGDSDTPPDVVTLVGYFGPSKRANYIRLYPSLDFHSYFEIPKSAVVVTTPTDPKDESSPTVVQVAAGTKVDAVQTTTQPVEAYLQGGITGGYLAGAAPTAAAVPATGSNCTICTVCTQIGCPLSAPPCSGVYTQCCAPTAQHPCSGIQTHCCPLAAAAPEAAIAAPVTVATVCTQIGCPSHLVVCNTHLLICNPTNPVICNFTPACPTRPIHCQPSHLVICPTPSIIPAHCPVNTLLCPVTPNCPTRICPSVAICPTVGICPSIACTPPVGGGGVQ
jgi:hypothetical protein